jgi:putative membrane protein
MDIAAFKKESMTGQNPDLKSFAGDTLPTVQQHLQMLQSKKMM